MKNVKIAFAGLAIFTAVATMSFTTENNEKVQANDCWSSQALHQSQAQPDRSTLTDCTGPLGLCCVKPNSSAPGGYDIFGFPEL